MVSLWFVTASYVIFNLFMVQVIEIFMITLQDVTNSRENNILREGTYWAVSSYSFLSVLLRLVM